MRHMSFSGMNLGYDSNDIFEKKKKNICNIFKSDFDYNIIKPLINNNNGDIKISGILTGNLKDLSF